MVKHISLAYRLYRTRRNICSVEQCKYIRKNIRIYVWYKNEMTNILYHAKKYWNKRLHIYIIYICVCVCIMFYVYPTFYIRYSMKYFIGFIYFRYMLHLRNIGIKGSVYIYIYIYIYMCVCVCIMFYVNPTFSIMYSMKYFIWFIYFRYMLHLNSHQFSEYSKHISVACHSGTPFTDNESLTSIPTRLHAE